MTERRLKAVSLGKVDFSVDLFQIGYYMFDEDDGKKAVRIARNQILIALGERIQDEIEGGPFFSEKSGVFVTLNTYPGGDLRGCIGYPEPIMELGKALKNAAVAAATQDPRFPSVTLKEMARVTVEVTLLTPPIKIVYRNLEELLSEVEIGKDGLIARKSFHSGLLLPQVPLEYGWSVEDFLSHTCMKAGMHPDDWRRGDVEFQKFSGRLFAEKKPGGRVEEIPLH